MAMARQQAMESINPATGTVLAHFPLLPESEVDLALTNAQLAYRSWRDKTFGERAETMRRTALHLRANNARFASLITTEMGKPIGQSEAEIEKCAWNCDFFADNAARFLADEPHPSTATESYVAFDPLGPVLAIMPWNYPFWQVFRFAAPTLMAGNTALLKHSSNVPQCALAIEEVFRAAGLPDGVFRTLLITGASARQLIADPRISAVTVTGSEATGQQVAMSAGSAVKKSVMELGGSDPFIVLADADLDSAAQVATRSRFQNSGQSCVAAKRFIVEDAVADAFLQRFAANVAALQVGDPAHRVTNVGPMARLDLLESLERQVRESIAQGARVVLGGQRLMRPGYFFAPTILTDLKPSMPVLREETFGPVAAVIRARDVDEAIDLANDTRYGLGADLWTNDTSLAKQLARRIEAGNVFINGMVSSDPRLPFGGIKHSGYGRELSEFGIREFTNVKTIWIGPAVTAQPQHAPSE